MKFLLSILTMIVIGSAVQAAPTTVQNMCLREPGIKGGDHIPWPWGNEIRFPWTRIQGIWAPVALDCDSYFVFKVFKQGENGEKFVRVLQYNPQNCEKIAEGVGYESANNVIYASMAAGSQSYDLTIRAFDTSVLEGQTVRAVYSTAPMTPRDQFGTAKSVIVVSLYPKYNWEKRTSYQLEKIRSNTALICHEE